MTPPESLVQTPFGRFEEAGDGQPVLSVHGGTASTREWRPVLESDWRPWRTLHDPGHYAHRAEHAQKASPDWPFGSLLRVAWPWALRPSGSALGGAGPTEPFGTRRPTAYAGRRAGSS
jgi:hypothetical protein